MIHLAVFLLATVGFAALALSTKRAHEIAFGRRPERLRSLQARLIGWAALAAALVVAISGHGWAYGLVASIGFYSLSAGLVFGCLILVDRRRAGLPLRSADR